MNNSIQRSIRALTILSLAVVLGTSAYAQSDMGAEKSTEGQATAEENRQKPEIPPGIVKKYDANKDGALDESEKAAWEADKAKQREKYKAEREAALEKYDTDKDGKLNKEEKDAMVADKLAEREAKKAEKESKKATKPE